MALADPASEMGVSSSGSTPRTLELTAVLTLVSVPPLFGSGPTPPVTLSHWHHISYRCINKYSGVPRWLCVVCRFSCLRDIFHAPVFAVKGFLGIVETGLPERRSWFHSISHMSDDPCQFGRRVSRGVEVT